MAEFCTVVDLEAFLGVAVPAERTAQAEAAIRGASAAIQNYTRQTIELVEGEEVTLDVRAGTRRLFLPQLPVTAVASVVEDGTALVVTDDYRWSAGGVLYREVRPWTSGVATVVVTYSHGYAPGAIPDTIWDVCRRAAARAYQAGLRASTVAGVPGVTGKTIGDYQVAFGTDQANGEPVLGASAAPILLRSEKEQLAEYRHKGLA